jgi:2-dehydro-3-deoxyphosphooctonate aldolase (KDO 8-P synthase)
MDFSKFTIIAGPCLIEGRDMLERSIETLLETTRELDINFIFKSSYRKANRSSAGAFSGIGDDEALALLVEMGEKYNTPITTDVHTAPEAENAGKLVDCVQIPAFLARQTDILEAAAKSGKIVNIKKAQFMAPEDVVKAAEKVKACGNDNILLTERGTFFGYHDLVVDFRALAIMKSSGYKTIYDATHSVQRPSIGEQSGGRPEFIRALAMAAVSVGVDGIFFETHPDPKNAKSDSATQLDLKLADKFIRDLYGLNKYFRDRNEA